jgi:hypothetical protein
VLGDVVRDAALEQLTGAFQAARAEHDQGGVDLVGDVDDVLPRGRAKVRARLGGKAGATGALGAVVRAFPGGGQVQLLERRAGTTEEIVATLSDGVRGAPTSITTARRGPRSSAAASIARRASSEPS